MSRRVRPNVEAFLEFHEDREPIDIEKAKKVGQAINALTIDLPGGGWLSTLVWNTRNDYLGLPGSTFSAERVQMICEGFLAEVEHLRSQIPSQQGDTA